MVTAWTGSGFAKKLFKRAPNDGMVGIGGSVSAIITLFTLYIDLKWWVTRTVGLFWGRKFVFKRYESMIIKNFNTYIKVKIVLFKA